MFVEQITGAPVVARAQPKVAWSLGGCLKWAQSNLFQNALSTVITISIAVFLLWQVPAALDWLLFSAVFTGEGRAACTEDAACWIPIADFFNVFVYGPYPAEQHWRVNVAFLLGVLAFPLLFSRKLPRQVMLAYIALLPVALWLLLKGGGILEKMPSTVFGGLMLTFFLGAIAMCLSLPVSILLALGRQSTLPVIRWICVAYIEFVRAVPLLTFLFMASLMLQIFLPGGMEIDRLLRVLVVMIFVSAAYKAEILRGAIQALPTGQTEASYAMGCGYWKTVIYIVMPQALRNSVPALINNFIGLFKETTLVMIVGLLELVGTVRAVFQDPEWIGLHVEGLLLVSFFFFIICFSIAQYGAHLERGIEASRR
ncbi:MAG: amino acid ABC transporter permease [Ruegeria sp.]|nr:amino acid ABC transporter permease [Ruegeria sp.]